MFPLIGIPETVAQFLKQYRKVFCREAGFKHIGHYITGLLMSSLQNSTGNLQPIGLG